MPSLEHTYQNLSSQIADACRAAGRGMGDVSLLAVSKTQPIEAVRALLVLGHRMFGENRVQEAAKKFEGLRAEFPDLRLHLIGQLQTNKAEDAVALFDVIEVLDRPRLADALDKAAGKLGKHQECLIEVNVGQEPQKAGILPHDLPDFLATCRAKQHLTISGLMAIPPQGQDAKPYFALLRDLAARHHLPKLSMGMSGDFAEAIACGSTEIRVGTALFGTRLP